MGGGGRGLQAQLTEKNTLITFSSGSAFYNFTEGSNNLF